MAVQPPEPVSDDDFLSRDATAVRVARHVAVLFGVDVPANPSGRTWMGDYNAITSADIGRGGPSGEQAGGGGIAPATLSKYGPETKAALVLTGADHLFETLRGRMSEVLDIVCQSEDTFPVADAMRVCAWASMLLDAYTAQPALFVSAVQARAVQRGALTRWAPRAGVSDRHGPDDRGIEFGTRRNRARKGADRSLNARDLGILDTMLHERVAPIAMRSVDSDVSNTFIIDELISRFVALILGSAESSYAKVVGEPGRQTVDTYKSDVGILSNFTTVNMQLFREVLPFPAKSDRSREDFDASNEMHWGRLIPRVPSLIEVRRLSEAGQVLLFRVLEHLLRVLRNVPDIVRERAFRRECRERLGHLASRASEVFGTDSFEAVHLRLMHAQAELADARLDTSGTGSETEVLEEWIERVVGTFEQLRGDFGKEMLPGHWLGELDIVSPALNMCSRELSALGKAEEGQRLLRELSGESIKAFAALDIDIMEDELGDLRQKAAGLGTPLHDWLGVAGRLTDEPELFSRAVDIGIHVLGPIRKELALVRRNDKAHRLTLQVLGSSIARGLDVLSETESAKAMTSLVRTSNDLLNTSLVPRLSVEPPENWGSAEINTALALVRIRVALEGRAGAEGSNISAAQVERLLIALHKAPLAPGTSRFQEIQALQEAWTVRPEHRRARVTHESRGLTAGLIALRRDFDTTVWAAPGQMQWHRIRIGEHIQRGAEDYQYRFSYPNFDHDAYGGRIEELRGLVGALKPGLIATAVQPEIDRLYRRQTAVACGEDNQFSDAVAQLDGLPGSGLVDEARRILRAEPPLPGHLWSGDGRADT